MTKSTLRCPRDGSELITEREYGIDVDHCPTCKGAWYEQMELELLEATVARDEGPRRGTIEYAKRQSELQCPHCGADMRAFDYRANNLELDSCPNEHGFWLDAGEADRVRGLMRERLRGLQRSSRAEEVWANFKRTGSGGVLDQLRDLFRGR
jgi:Zn-finger nucleic acid-binding protein